jgi:hypothetical protein
MADIFGVRVTTELSILDSLIVICNSIVGQTEPAVTWAGQNYFVTYLDAVSETRAGIVKVQRVSPDGTVLDNGANVGFGDYNPEIAFDGSRCLVVWSEEFHGVTGRFVNASGQPEGAGFEIAMTVGLSTLPELEFGDQYYLVVWPDFCPTGTDLDIYGQLVATDGTLIGGRITIAEGPASQNFPAITFDGNRFMVVWVENTNAIHGRLIAENGMPAGAEFPISDNTQYERHYPSVAAGTDYFLTVWSEFHTDFDIYGNTDVSVDIHENSTSTAVQNLPLISGQLIKYIGNDMKLYDVIGRRVQNGYVGPGIYFAETENKELKKIVVVR